MLELNYKNYLIFNINGRNDWSSTLPLQNNNFFSPSAGLSFISVILICSKTVFYHLENLERQLQAYEKIPDLIWLSQDWCPRPPQAVDSSQALNPTPTQHLKLHVVLKLALI